MNENQNEIQADANEIVEQLTIQVANLTRENAILNSLVNQYKKRLESDGQGDDN